MTRRIVLKRMLLSRKTAHEAYKMRLHVSRNISEAISCLRFRTDLHPETSCISCRILRNFLRPCSLASHVPAMGLKTFL
jgi:hypothetical protein